MSSDWITQLNPAQREAVEHGEGPLLIVAGAGTGKTRTLVCRVAHLIEQGVPPERILLLTFTRRAAAQMIERVRHMVEAAKARQVWGGTFHAIANRLLRTYGRAVDLSPEFTVMDQGDAADLMNLIRGELGLATAKRRFPQKRTLVKIYSHTVNAQRPLADVVTTHFPWCRDDIEGMTDVFRQYTERKSHDRVLDYDDLLLYWRMLCAAPRVGGKIAGLFQHILVDEYQDTNSIQCDILRTMRKTNHHVTAVGDDAQSIYSFRAATVRNILDFPEHFPGTHIVALEENYRSTKPILAASNAVMAHATERYTKELWSDREAEHKPILSTCMDEAEQCDRVCGRILEHLEQGIPLTQQAVLFRASHHSAQLEIELARRNIPFHKYGGLRFLEAAHIKDMLALLRILQNPYDRLSWFRVLQLLPGIGARTAQRIMAELIDAPPEEARRETETAAPPPAALEVPWQRLFSNPPSVPPAARVDFTNLRAALAECRGVTLSLDEIAGKPPEPRASARADVQAASDFEARTAPAPSPPPAQPAHRPAPPLSAQLQRLGVFYEPICARTYDNPKPRLRDIEQLEQIASRYRSRSRFITDLALDPPTSTSDLAGAPHLDEDYLILSTMHSAKGCEWTSVHILHAADGMIPSDMATTDDAGIDEERRLFYVAMTRAKDHLHVHFPLRYYHTKHRRGDAHSYAQLTRFITAKIKQHFSLLPSGELQDDSDASPETAEQLRSWLDGLWTG